MRDSERVTGGISLQGFSLYCASAKWLSFLSAARMTATAAIRQASAYQAEYAHRSRRACNLQVGDFVLLSTMNLMPESYQEAQKLLPKY